MKQFGLLAALGLVLSIGAVSAHDIDMPAKSSKTTVSIDDDSSFDAQMTRTMELMHREMAVTPSGNPDRDFAAMMIPHHQGAVDMARIQLQFGKDPVLRRLAEGIIVEQLQEIDVMKRALAQTPAATAPQPALTTSTSDHKAH